MHTVDRFISGKVNILGTELLGNLQSAFANIEYIYIYIYKLAITNEL